MPARFLQPALLVILESDSTEIESDFAIFGECVAKDYAIALQLLEMAKLNAKSRYLASICQRIVNLLPRLDIAGHGVDIKRITPTRLEGLFVGQDSDFSKLIYLEPKTDEEFSIRKHGIPLKGTGNAVLDLFVRLSGFGQEWATIAIQTYGVKWLSAYCDQMVEVNRDPEDRTREYLYEEYKKKNPSWKLKQGEVSADPFAGQAGTMTHEEAIAMLRKAQELESDRL